jgi:hypothetical protein
VSSQLLRFTGWIAGLGTASGTARAADGEDRSNS